MSGKPKRAGLIIEKNLKSKSARCFLDEINLAKIGIGKDHNKLRFDKLLKGSFKKEPYINQIKNRNQRQ